MKYQENGTLISIDNSLCQEICIPDRKTLKIPTQIFSVIQSLIFQTKHSGTITAEKNWIFLPHSETKNLQQCLMAALNANKRIMASHENLSRLEKKRKKENRRTAALKLQWSNRRELPNSVGVFRIS